MKKILLFVLLLIPFHVDALEEWYYSLDTPNYYSCDNCSSNYYYSHEVTYENGKYHLGELVTSTVCFPGQYQGESDVIYRCPSTNQKECDSVYAVFLKTSCDNNRTYHPAFKFSGGSTYENSPTMKIGKSFTYENGIYTLKDIHEYNYQDTSAISLDHHKEFICLEHYQESCTSLSYIGRRYNTAYGKLYDSFVKVEDALVIGDSYKVEDNKYVLLNTRLSFVADESDVTGYTCRSKDDKCDKLYHINITDHYDIHDGGRRVYFDLLDVNKKITKKTLKINDEYDITSFFLEDELLNVFSTNPEVADIKDGKLVLYKVGKTDIIYENIDNYKALQLNVIDNYLPKNPKTHKNIIILLLVVIFGFYCINLKRIKKKD